MPTALLVTLGGVAAVLGGFTTLSTLTVQTVLEADGGRPATAALYFAVSTFGGLACAASGYALGRVLA